MGESPLHEFLKKVGAAFLYNQGCFTVATEVMLNRVGQRRIHELDGHDVIDVCGVGEKYIPLCDGGLRPETGDIQKSLNTQSLEVGCNILRGIEVKVSRGDFRNGFICSGCNYNYLLTPMRLVAPYEVPKGVGLIEYNRFKFSCELTEEDRFRFKGLRVVKRPAFRRIPRYQIDNAIAEIARHSIKHRTEVLADELSRGNSINQNK